MCLSSHCIALQFDRCIYRLSDRFIASAPRPLGAERVAETVCVRKHRRAAAADTSSDRSLYQPRGDRSSQGSPSRDPGRPINRPAAEPAPDPGHGLVAKDSCSTRGSDQSHAILDGSRSWEEALRATCLGRRSVHPARDGGPEATRDMPKAPAQTRSPLPPDRRGFDEPAGGIGSWVGGDPDQHAIRGVDLSINR